MHSNSCDVYPARTKILEGRTNVSECVSREALSMV
jgi:hypothetical protein